MKINSYYALVCIVVFFAGCRGGPLGIFSTKTAKVDAAKQALVENRTAQVTEAAKHVYATGLALDAETNKTPAVVVAADFNELAQVTLGAPAVDDVGMLKEMLAGLLSTNQDLRASAARQKKALEGEVVDLQKEREKLQDKLDTAETKRDAAYESAAKKAASYDKWRARIYWIVGILGGGFLLSIILPALSVAFPALAPFSALFSSLYGTITKTIFRVVPASMAKAQVVSQEVHAVSETTLRDLVTAITQVQIKSPQVYLEAVKPELKNATSRDDSRPKIEEIKQRLATLSPP